MTQYEAYTAISGDMLTNDESTRAHVSTIDKGHYGGIIKLLFKVRVRLREPTPLQPQSNHSYPPRHHGDKLCIFPDSILGAGNSEG